MFINLFVATLTPDESNIVSPTARHSPDQLAADSPAYLRDSSAHVSCRVFFSQVDSSLSMLDEFVSEAILSGAPPYKPPSQREPGTVKREYGKVPIIQYFFCHNI